uniref:Uncharacterized protein n=1 Tax=Brassica campestris TaxID=3711 RepID=A0A3P5YYG0_BRACM|nr:unnamed protein product [Brassica rapa]
MERRGRTTIDTFVATKTEDRYCSIQRSITWWAHCRTWTIRFLDAVSKTCIKRYAEEASHHC